MIIEQGKSYKNIKNGKTYGVLYIAAAAWDAAQALAVYQDVIEQTARARPVAEFKEKFQEV